MALLGKKYSELGRGYEQKSEFYKCPYVIGVDVTAKEKPYVVAMGAHHSDNAGSLISQEELISGKWDNHIKKSNCQEFVAQLKIAIKNQEPFPQQFLLELVNS